jgi:hypothetical protein
MEQLIKTSSSAVGQAVVAAIPVIVGAAMAGAGILALGIVLTTGVIWVARTME